MKVKDQDLSRQRSDNTKLMQENTASHDYVEQRAKGVEETEAKTKKQQQKRKKSGN